MAKKALQGQFRDSYWFYYHFIGKVSDEKNNSMKVDR